VNNKRRKQLHAIDERLLNLLDDIGDICKEEQEAFDNMPESLQNSAKGEIASAAIDALQDAVNALDEASAALSEALT